MLPNLLHGMWIWPSRGQVDCFISSRVPLMRIGRLHLEPHAAQRSPTQPAAGPGCSCNANKPSFHWSQQPCLTDHKHWCQSLPMTSEQRSNEHTAPWGSRTVAQSWGGLSVSRARNITEETSAGHFPQLQFLFSFII